MEKRMIPGIFLVLILTASSILQAGTPDGKVTLPEVKTYDQLRHAISEARAQSRARVEKAVEQERVREAWEIGRLIDAHVLQHKERADYDKQVIPRLVADLGMSEREFYYSLQFYRAYPILPHASKLSWSEYRELLSVNDPKERQALAEQVEKEGWDRDRLRKEVKALKGTGSAVAGGGLVPLEESLLTAKLGKVGTYRIVKATAGPDAGKGVIDLGFSNYYKTSRDLGFKEGTLIESAPGIVGGSSPNDKIKRSRRTFADLYTYRAYVVRVLDGDTVEVVVDLGFGVRSVQTLRLRGLDCPELVSKEGKEAKAFVEKMLEIPEPVIARSDEGATRQSVLIKTTKSDKYDRYLADVFYTDKTGKEQYLNNRLLEEGHAVRVRE